MKNKKETFFVNIAFTYINVIVISYPFYVVSIYLFSLINYYLNANSNYLLEVDTFNLFININRYFSESLIKAKGFSSFTVASLFLSNFFYHSVVYSVLWSLRRFLKNISTEDYLSIENGKILKGISVKVVLIAISIKVIQIITNQIQVIDLVGRNIRLGYDFIELGKLIFDPILIICSSVYIIGNVIIKGAAIKQENDLTV